MGQPNEFNSLQEEFQINLKHTESEIKVDGLIEEKEWSEVEKAADFWMSFPTDGVKVDEEYRTEAMVTYDDKYIYIAAICHGGFPYVMPTLKRDAGDFWQGEVFGIVLDPLNEKTNAFIFATNTSGVQVESLISGGNALRNGNNSAEINGAWDQTWISEGKVYEDRWTVEIAIPFKSLRYGPNIVWGINFYRGVSSTNEWQSWTKTSVEFMTIDIGHTGAMIWDSPPKVSKNNIAIVPYILQSTHKDIANNEPRVNNFRYGGDAKIALSSSMNLDLTINPDFSQVDVDEQVTNLTTVNIRFPERRLFFLENSDLYADFGIPPIRPFFSRKIGLDDDGNAIPIAYGVRLSGNMNKNLRLGVMNLQTRITDEFRPQNYTSLTAHQQVLGRSRIKGYFHNRQATGSSDVPQSDYNRIGGVELLFQSPNDKWRTFGGYGKSWTTGLKGDDFFYNCAVGYSDRNLSFYTNLAGVGDNYRTDMGFNPRFSHYDAVQDTTFKVGYHHGFSTLRYRIQPKIIKAITSHTITIRNSLDYTEHGFDLIQNTSTLEYNVQWVNTSRFSLSFTHENQGLLYPFAFTDEAPLPPGTYNFSHFQLNYNSNATKSFSYFIGYRNGGFYNGDRQEYRVRLKYRMQPWGNFGLNFNFNKLDFPENFGSNEIFLVGPKLEFNFSRNLFWTTFLQYNTQEDNFNLNSRIQWRFKPLSDIFLVYSDNYATDIWGPKNRGLVVKMNYWVNL